MNTYLIIMSIIFAVGLFDANSDSLPNLIKFPYLKTECIGPEACPYSGESFYYKVWGSPDSIGGSIENYRFEGCETKCKYDNDQLRNSLIEMINNNMAPANMAFDNEKEFFHGMCLSAYYEFPNCPDFVLLKYHIVKLGPLFFGYIKSKNMLYILDDLNDQSLRNNYNRMLNSNPDILNIDPICRAALILSLTYRRVGPVLLGSMQDIYPATAIEFGPYLGIQYPFDPGDNDLYIFDILEKSGMQEFAEQVDSIFDLKHNLSEVQQIMEERKLSISPPKVFYSQNNTIVELASYNKWSCYIEWWRIEFDNAGILIRQQLIDSVQVRAKTGIH